jgi:hypothetical protein
MGRLCPIGTYYPPPPPPIIGGGGGSSVVIHRQQQSIPSSPAPPAPMPMHCRCRRRMRRPTIDPAARWRESGASPLSLGGKKGWEQFSAEHNLKFMAGIGIGIFKNGGKALSDRNRKTNWKNGLKKRSGIQNSAGFPNQATGSVANACNPPS